MPTEPPETVTLRFPAGLLARARDVKAEQESLNDLIVEAVEREIHRRGMRAYDAILRLREQIKAEVGLHPDSVPRIRALREGEDRRR